MSLMKLHEDSPISDYVSFDIVELDWSVFSAFSPTIYDGAYTAGSSIGHRFTTYCANDNLYTALSTNCPRSASDSASIIKSSNLWGIDTGIYKRTDTITESVEFGVKPADFDTSPHYYVEYLNTPDASFPEQYLVNISKENIDGGAFNANTHYVKDISTPENRMTRRFIADSSLTFSVFRNVGVATANPSSSALSAFMSKNESFCCFSGSVGSGVGYYYKNNYYWTLNGELYNPYVDYNSYDYASVFTVGMIQYTVLPPTVIGWNSLKQEQNTSQFFIHTNRDGIDYYGVAYIVLSDFTENAIPVKIYIAFFETPYWGTSVIAGGTTPSGNWGPVSGQSGGGGTWDNSDDSESIYAPTLINYLPSVFNYGGLHIYQITDTMLNKFIGVLYNPTSANNFWSKWLNQKFNPISGIISLHVLPDELRPTFNLSQESVHISGAILNDAYMGDVGAVTAYTASEQYHDTSEYTLSLPEYFGSFYDYEPFTKCYLHLPFCGILNVSANEIIHGSISVQYRCDALTGNVCAIVKCVDRFGVKKVHYATGNCAYTLPIVGRDDGAIDNLKSLVSGGLAFASGNFRGMFKAVSDIANREHTTTVQGDISGNSAPLSDLKLWLEVVRVVPSTPENKQDMQGIPANAYTLLYSLSGTGYAVIDSIRLENIADATSNELNELENILKSGVVF